MFCWKWKKRWIHKVRKKNQEQHACFITDGSFFFFLCNYPMSIHYYKARNKLVDSLCGGCRIDHRGLHPVPDAGQLTAERLFLHGAELAVGQTRVGVRMVVVMVVVVVVLVLLRKVKHESPVVFPSWLGGSTRFAVKGI